METSRTSSERDLPFYDGVPVDIKGTGWLLIVTSVLIAFLALILIPLRSFPYNLLPTALFVGIPLLALRVSAGQYWICLFHALNGRSLGIMLLFGLATLVGSISVGWVLQQFSEAHANPVANEIALVSTTEIGEAFFVTSVQLVGEELLGILPFLAALWLCVRHLGMSRRLGILIALIVSGLSFGAAHLPTYNWHWAQSLIGIGSARIRLGPRP